MQKEKEAGTQGPEGARRATEGSWVPAAADVSEGVGGQLLAGSGISEGAIRGAEVSDKATRRRFTAEYKERILKLADGCNAPGSVGALLRKEGLYSSTLTLWRRQRKEGTLSALDGRKRGRKGPTDPLVVENQKLSKENQGLKEHLRKAELVIDIQKKVLQMLECGREARKPEGSN